MMRAAVVGPRSMLGRALVGALQLRGVEVIRVGRSVDDDIVLDLAEEGPISGVYGSADALFVCAASFDDDSANGLRSNLQTNTLGAAKCAEIADALGVTRVIYAGSASSDARTGAVPESSYGLSKALAESVLQWSAIHNGWRFCSVRLPQLYDVDGRCVAHQQWFGRIVAYAWRGLDLAMPSGSSPRNFLNVEDAAQILIESAQFQREGILHACHPENLDYHAIARLAYEIFERGGAVRIAAQKASFREVDWPSATLGIFDGWSPMPMRQGLAAIRDAGTAEKFGPLDVT